MRPLTSCPQSSGEQGPTVGWAGLTVCGTGVVPRVLAHVPSPRAWDSGTGREQGGNSEDVSQSGGRP